MEEEIQKKEYEIGFLLNEESDAAGLIDALKAAGAEVKLEGPVKKIALAYEIKKHQSAWFGYVQCAMEPEVAKSLETTLNLKAEVLRFLIITPPPSKEKTQPSTSGAPRMAGKTLEAKPSSVLSNEALEKTIEEILK